MTLIDLARPPVYSSRLSTLPVAIIGAGPIGLAAAANLVERGIAGFRTVGRRTAIALMTYGPYSDAWRDTVLVERRSTRNGRP